MNVEVIRGADADARLSGDAFVADWCALRAQCPWATAYQSAGFARAWYATYRQRWEPLLVLLRGEGGALQGLMALAVAEGGPRLVAAGAHQAEYQGWICRPELADEFPPRALRALREHVPGAVLKFQYLPAGTPTAWLAGAGPGRLYHLRRYNRPLLQFNDGSEIAESLSKEGNKSRLRRLKKLGPTRLERVADAAQLEAIFDTIIHWHDARRLAVNGSAPFRNDPLKRPFHLAMMREGGLLHVTVLKAGDRIASAHLNVCGRGVVQLGLLAHDPALSRHSPGKLHILLLAPLLMQEGYAHLDLTPGGEPYKARFANGSDPVYTLSVLPTFAARFRDSFRSGAEDAAKSLLRRFRVAPADAEALVDRLRRLGSAPSPLRALSLARKWIRSTRELTIHRYDAAKALPLDVADRFHRDAVEDLLAYAPLPGLPSRRQFVSEALARIEQGQHVYTCADEGGLLHYGWLAERVTAEVAGRHAPEFPCPPDSAMVLHFYTFPRARRRGLAAECLRTMLRDAARVPGTRQIYAAVPADAEAALRLVAKIGFTVAGRFSEDTIFGRSRARTQTADGAAPAATGAATGAASGAGAR